MILRIYRFLCGYLTLLLSGRKAGRFLNLCTRRGMNIWNVVLEGEDRCRLNMYLKDFRNVRPLCRKTKTRLRIQKRRGLPFVLYRYRKRVIFPAAFLAAAGLLFFCSRFVWKIEIDGNSRLSDDTIIRYLEENNAGFGTAKKEIDLEKLELSLRRDFPQIIWASSYIEGTRLVVEIQENLKEDGGSSASDGADASCTDLIAAKDAVIDSIITRSGVPLVKAGDPVAAGDVLVSSRQEILDDAGNVREYFYQSADADITGRVTYPYEEKIPAAVSEKKETGREHTVYFVEFFGRRMETPKIFNDFDLFYCIEDYRQLHLTDHFYLPVFFGKRSFIEQEEQEKTYSKEEAEQIAAAHLNQFLSDLEENGVSIIGKNVMIDKIGDFYQVSGTIEASEPVGAKAPTEILQIPGQDEEHE